MIANESDEQLMARVQKGDHDAVRGLFDRYRQPLFGFFFSRVGTVDSAEDLVQAVFVRLWTYRSSYSPGRSLRPWLFRIARNALSETGRDRLTEPLSEDLAATDPDPAQELDVAERAAVVRDALAQLPAPQRDALLMSRWSGMGYRDIAEVLGCSEGAVKLRVFRAMQNLRARLEPALGEI